MTGPHNTAAPTILDMPDHRLSRLVTSRPVHEPNSCNSSERALSFTLAGLIALITLAAVLLALGRILGITAISLN